eukprot:CAMPEP_0118657134 /NCGR_PEP_ID=MMETSP0785-20121206/13852_1 /TAXON_ID=91992 /ORGANISM="Bolidomonas pacifica, Strain CCMP 1866" /LENGTH=49 /DNA_ID=CAMNT_0006550023 /DNA_START=249 /DNA_END=398 /DNA_ORIENTATION=-
MKVARNNRDILRQSHILHSPDPPPSVAEGVEGHRVDVDRGGGDAQVIKV